MKVDKMDGSPGKHGGKVFRLGWEKGRKLSIAGPRCGWVRVLKIRERKIRTGLAGSGVELL
jgi:hypothetical protein